MPGSTDQSPNHRLTPWKVLACPTKVVKSNYAYIRFLWWLYLKAHFVSHDIQMLGRSPIKWKKYTDMTIAVDWDVKQQTIQTNKMLKRNFISDTDDYLPVPLGG